MMGYEQPEKGKQQYIEIDIEERVRKNHPLRKIKELIDWDFIYEEVKDTYGNRGNISVPPPIILKLMVLLVFYNVRSERKLMETLPERIDWLWFFLHGAHDMDSIRRGGEDSGECSFRNI